MPDPRQKLYGALSKDFDLGTFEEFNSKMNNPESRKKLYGAVSKTMDLGDYSEFESKVAPVKKKETSQSPSTSQKTQSASPSEKSSLDIGGQTTDRSVLSKRNLGVDLPKQQPAKLRDEKLNQQIDSKYPVGSIAWSQEKMKANVPGYTSIYDEYKKKSRVPEEEKQKIIQEVEKDANNEGIMNTLKQGAGLVLNPIFRAFTEWEEPKNGESRPELIDSDPLKKEREEAKKILLEQSLLNKKQNKPSVKITPETVTEKAKEIAVEKRLKSKEYSNTKDYLKSLEDYAPEKKQALISYSELEKKSLNDKDKLLLAKQNVTRDEFVSSGAKLQEMDRQYQEMQKNNIPVTEEFVNEFKKEKAIYDESLSETLKLHDEYVSEKEKLGTIEDNLDIFKRDYGFMKNFLGNVASTTGDLVSGGAGAMNYLNNIQEETFGKTESTKKRSERLTNFSKLIKDVGSEVRSEIARPVNVDDINNVSDFGDWFFDNLVGNQAPILALTMTGAGGISYLGASATGQKYDEMKSEQGEGAEYSDSDFITAPAIFGATETASAIVDRYLIGNSARVIRSATEPERKIIAQSMAKSLLETTKKTGAQMVKSSSIEAIDESATEIMQDITDKYVLGKDIVIGENLKDVGAMGAMMGALFPLGSGGMQIASELAKPFSADTKIQKASAQVVAFEKQLDNLELAPETRKIIEGQLKSKKSEVESLLKRKVKDIESMPDSQVKEVIDIEKKKNNIKSQAEDTQLDDNLSTEMKEQLLNNLKAEFKSNESRRVDLVQRGGNSALLNLEEDEIIRLKDKASRELMKEKNPDGTKSVTLKDAEITQRAGQILTNEIKSRQQKDEAKLAEQQQESKSETQPKAQEQEKVSEVKEPNIKIEYIDPSGKTNVINTKDIEIQEKDIDFDGKKLNNFIFVENGNRLGNVEIKTQPNNQASVSLSGIFNPELQRKGLGSFMYGKIARLLKEKYGLDLVSDISRTKDADALWKKLEREGKASIVGDKNKGITDYYYKFNNESSQTKDIAPDGNIRPEPSIMEESGTAVEENNTAENVPESVDAGTGKIDAEVEFDSLKKGDKVSVDVNGKTVEDIIDKVEDGAVRLKNSGVWRTKSSLSENPISKINEKEIQDESNTGPEAEGVQENNSVPKEKRTRKPRTAKTEKNITKPSMRGKTPLDKRKIKDKTMIKALDADTVTPYDAVQQFFIGGGRVLTDDIKSLLGSGEEARLRQQYARTKEKGGQTIDAISDKLWQEYGAESGIDQMDFKNAIEDVIRTSISTKAMAENFLERNGIDQKEEGEMIETPYGPMTQQQLDDFIAYEEMHSLGIAESESQHQEAISFLETLTDEEMIRLAEEENMAFEDFLNEIEQQETERDYSDAREVQSMGISMRKEGKDFSLSKGGSVKELNPFRRKFKRLWNRTFKSNAGLNNSTGEVIRSLDRDISNYTDSFNAETTEFKKIVNKVKKKAKDSEDYRKKVLLINDYMAGADVALSFVNSDEKAKLDYMRGRIDNLSDGIIERLGQTLKNLEGKEETAYTKEAIEKTKMLIETINANKEKYINRTYQIFTDESYRDAITQPYENLNAEGRRRVDKVVDFLIKKEGFTEEQARSYVAGYLDDIKRAKVDVNMASKGKAEADFLKRRKDLPVEFQELLGVSNDPIYNYIHTVFKLANYLASVSYQERLRTNLLDEKIAITEPKQGYTKLTSDSETWKVLSDLYVPNDVKEAMDDMMPLERIDNDFLRYWVKMASLTKVGKTILNPTGTFRNFLSGNFLGLNSGHFLWANPKNAYNSMHQAWGTEKSRKELGEFRRELIAEGIVGEGGASGEMLAYMNDFSKPVDRLVSNNPLLKAFDFMQKAYAFGDDFFKVGGYVIEKNRLMRDGLSEKEARRIAGERNRGGYPTYSYLPKTFQQLRRVPIIGTFVSFPYEVIRSTKNNALYAYEDFKAGRNKMASQRVAGMIIANALPTLLSVYSTALIGFSDEDEDALRNMLPEYQKDSLLYYTGKEDGKPTFIDLTVYFPSEVAVKPLRIVMEERAGRNSVEKVAISIDEVTEPYIGIDLSTKTMKELIENENEYNKKIYEGKNLMEGVFNNPGPIANYYMKKAGAGVYNNITEFARANEVNPEFFGEKNTSYGKEYTNQDALWGFFGFRFSTVNYDNALSNYGKETKEYLKENRSKVGKGFNSTIPLEDEKVKELVTKYVDKNDEVYSNFINSINSAEKLGMDKNQIGKSLKHSGFKKEDIIYLLNDVPPATPIITKDAFLDQLDRIDVNNKKEKAVELKKIYLENAKKFNREIERQNKERLKLFLKEKKEKDSD